MHPWKDTKNKAERVAKHAEFNLWLANNQQARIRHGTTRDDGRVFIGYKSGYPNGEAWVRKQTYERALERQRQNAKVNNARAEVKERKAQWQRDNPPGKEAKAARSLEWRTRFPEKNRAKSMKRYAAKLARLISGHSKMAEEVLHAMAKRLTGLTGITHQVDHIIPLMAGGWHHHENMQVLPRFLNQSKKDNPFWLSPSPQYKDWRSVPAWLWPDHLASAYEERLYNEAMAA